MRQFTLWGSLFALLCFSGEAVQATPLRPPPGWYQAVEQRPDTHFTCPPAPAPFTGSLVFRSKYEGSDQARATLNPDAEAANARETAPVTTLEKQVSGAVRYYLRTGDVQARDCALTELTTWAAAGALQSRDTNHPGRSMRKWALASLSGAWLYLKFSPSHPLEGHEDQARQIETWFSLLADLVVSDWQNLPLSRVNNHSYWAAWALMSTAVATNRRDLFDHGLAAFSTAAHQIDGQGYLPNELKRRQRALSYHNYALQPLVMIASFALANQVDVRGENHNALQRLGNQVLASLRDPAAIAAKTGAHQLRVDIHHASNVAWLAPWCTLYHCDGETLSLLHNAATPLLNTRLGGDLGRAYPVPETP